MDRKNFLRDLLGPINLDTKEVPAITCKDCGKEYYELHVAEDFAHLIPMEPNACDHKPKLNVGNVNKAD